VIIPDNKKVASVILSRMGKDESSDVPLKPEVELDPMDEGLKAAAEEALAAVKSGSAHDFMVALRSFFEQCDAMPHEEAGEE